MAVICNICVSLLQLTTIHLTTELFYTFLPHSRVSIKRNQDRMILMDDPIIHTISRLVVGVLQRGFGDEQVPGPEIRKVPAAGTTTYRNGARMQGIDLTFIPSPTGTPNHLTVCNNRAALTHCSSYAMLLLQPSLNICGAESVKRSVKNNVRI